MKTVSLFTVLLFGLLLANGFMVETAVSSPTQLVPTVELVSLQPGGLGYIFVARVNNATPNTQYDLVSYHHTDMDYPQETLTLTTDQTGSGSIQIESRYKDLSNNPFGYVFVELKLGDEVEATSNQVDCPALRTVADFGAYLESDTEANDWSFPPTTTNPVKLWLTDDDAAAGLTGTVTIRSAATGYLLASQPLVDEGNGRYRYDWTITGRTPARDYRVQFTLQDGSGGISGIDFFVHLEGRSMWVWGEATETGNPQILAIMTNTDYDNNGIGDRDEWIAFHTQVYNGQIPFITTSYFSIFPYISFTGTTDASTIQAFLVTAHAQSIRVEALAGTHKWMETDSGLADGKALCDQILAFNMLSTDPNERFDGIHYDVEHDDWFINNHWDRFIELITYCQTQVDLYNQTYSPAIRFGVDVPPRFETDSVSTGQVQSFWDVLSIVDYATLLDYRDFANIRWDNATEGIVHFATGFLNAATALGKPVEIGVELTPNSYDHVTFFEECPAYLENELKEVAQAFIELDTYQGLALHSYSAWKEKSELLLSPTMLREPQRLMNNFVLPTLDVTVQLDETDFVFVWDHESEDEQYEIHRSTSPYFVPDAGTLIETLDPPANGHTDFGYVGTPQTNYFYHVKVIGCNGEVGVLANHTGEFDFSITPGTP